MAGRGLTGRVSAFLDAHIDSIPQIEALLLLHEGRQQAWTIAQIAARIYMDAAQTEPLLRHLQQHQLAEGLSGAGEATFRFAPREGGDDVVSEVAIAYRTQLIAVTGFIHAKAPSSVLDFARAFDLKKDR
jgi:hypothetical protein